MNFLEILKMNCRQATCLHSKQQEDKLNFAEKLGLKIHLAYCSLCRLFFAQLDSVEKQTQQLSRSEKISAPLSDTEKERIKKHFDISSM